MRRNAKSVMDGSAAAALLDSDYSVPSYRPRDRRSMIVSSPSASFSFSTNYSSMSSRDREAREGSSSASSASASLASVLASLEKFSEGLDDKRGSGSSQGKLVSANSVDSDSKVADKADEMGCFPDKYKFVDEKHKSIVLKEMLKMWEDDLLTDVILEVEDQEFKCHRLTLAACSPYFHAMFSSGLVESHQDRISIGGIDAASMKLILEYAYSAEIEINEDNVQGLMLAVNMFQINNLRDACARFLEHHVTVGNCIGIYFFAAAHDCNNLQEQSKKLVCDRFNQVFKEEEFLSLSKDKVIDLLSQDDLNVDREETVYEAALTWIRGDIDNRKYDIVDVLRNVRFALTSPYFIHDVVERDRIVSSNSSCQQMIDRALQYHVLRERRQDLDLSNINTVTRKGMPFSDMFVFLANHTEAIAASLNSDTYRVKALPDMMEFAACAVTGENNIYVAGRKPPEYGSSRRTYTSYRRGGIFLYDHFERKWLPRSSMNVQRSLFSMTSMDGTVYATGGCNAEGALDSAECYDPATNSWRFIAPLPKPIKQHCSAAVLGRLYCIGGETNDQTLDTVHCYNPRIDSWETVASMILPRSCAGVGVLNREIYVIGGNVAKDDKDPENMLKSVEIYNPDENEWRFGPELPEGRMSYQVVSNNGTLYVFGGENGLETTTADASKTGKAHKLDLKKNVWVEDSREWPNLSHPFYCIVARMSKKDS